MYTQLVREFFPFVEKPGRYSGGELNALTKERDSVKLMGVLCFPELYDIGMSHFGSQILYHIVNQRAQWALARTYMPWFDAEKIMREKKIPLYSLEYFEPVKKADWLGFSMQYELQFANVVNILDLAQIPVFSKERTISDPIIIAGGPSMANPEPLADIFDIILPGDGEEAIVAFCDILEQAKNEGLSRQETLLRCKVIPNAYIPSLYSTEILNGFVVPTLTPETPAIKAAKIAAFSEENNPEEQIVPLVDVIHHRMAIEVMRGCTRGCRFCAAGYYDRPIREKPVEQIAQQIHRGIAATGWDDVNLLSLSTADYMNFGDLLCAVGSEMAHNDLKVSLPSTRIDAISPEEFALLDTISPGSSLTIAPEAGSQRLRNVINKDFSRETIIAMVKELMKNSHQTIKFYFMVGLPTETEQDIDELIELVGEISSIVWLNSHRRNINVAISPFAPKPSTPFQWEELCSQQNLIERCKRIKLSLKKYRNVKVDYRDSRMARLETILNRGDRALGPVIYTAWKKGARFDGWNDQFNQDRWFEAAEECGVDLTKYTDAIPLEQPLPWQAIDMGIDTAYLLEERTKAYQEVTISDCREQCHVCGVCTPELDMLYSDSTHSSPAEMQAQLVSNTEERLAEDTRQFFRLHYAKDESIRFLGHRNIVDILTRACKAAKIPVSLSVGYKPHPKISFGPPLPLGATGAYELFDLALHKQTSLDVTRLKPFLPPGLQVLDAQPLDKKPTAITETITAGDWTITSLITLTEEEITTAVATFLAQEQVIITRTSKKGVEKEVDLRPLVYALSVDNGSMICRLSMSPLATCRPMDLLAQLFPHLALWDFAITRTACLVGENNQWHVM